jgi:hypothetical protein
VSLRPLSWAVVLLIISAPLLRAQSLPAPRQVTAADDPKEDKGTQLLLTWQAPAEAPPGGLSLAGYRVYLLSGKDKPKPLELLVAPPKLATKVPDLKPWRKVRLAVTAIYIPGWVTLAPDEQVATEPASADFRESTQTLSPPASPTGIWFKANLSNVLVFSLFYVIVVILTIAFARRRDMYIRPIAGLRAVDDAIGRATEMGRPILYIAGLTGIGDISTIAAMLVLGHLAKRTAAYETPILVPCQDPLVMAIQREIVREAYLEAGKPDAYNPDNIFYVTDSQFGYVAAVDGLMLRQKPAANFFMGYFYAESLILAETGNATGAIQISGTDADTQLPFFITSCDYTLMGEELYAASAYLSRDPVLLAQLKGQDLGKLLIFLLLLAGLLLITLTGPAGHWLLKLFEVQ